MEKAVLVNNLEALSHLEDTHQRLYFGNEYCERLIPSPDDTLKAFAAARERGKEITLITPYIFEKGLSTLERLLDRLEKEHPALEVVFNDWGVLAMLKDRFQPVLGRLINRQTRGPRIKHHMELLNQEDAVHYQRCIADHEFFTSFLCNSGVTRIELDNLLHGIDYTSSLPASLYVPYGYVTTTRFCLAILNERLDNPEDKVLLRQLQPCSRECLDKVFHLQSDRMPVPLYVRGTSEFFRNEHLPENVGRLNIDRIVIEPEVPY